MKTKIVTLLLALATLLVQPNLTHACGGFFCSASPVDQNAERIVFAIDEASDSTEMVVQIAYQGEDDAFAWLLPVGAVPQNRKVFPNGALAPLDAQTGPSFQPPPNCSIGEGDESDDDAAPASSNDAGGVTVHVRETVGPFDVVVLESPDAALTFKWLVDNGYRLSPVMKPYIQLYTEQRMMFLALKLTASASVNDIQPFRMTLPGTTPTIPLRLTAIAAEPEMGVVVWIFGQRRYEPANAPEITIPKEELRWDPRTFRTNWAELIARKVDEQGGRGWVVEQAGPTDALRVAIANTFASDGPQTEARDALLGLLEGRPYMTRLYTRVAAEEMSYDPSFKRSDKGDVSRVVELPDALFCSVFDDDPDIDECDFAACGQLGLCRTTTDSTTKSRVAACACAPGATARTTFDPQGRPIVTCQDQRMSFMNPGERDESGAVFADPCVGFSCGEHGRCVAMNLTPTCECEAGYVALAPLGFGAGGRNTRSTKCVLPSKSVPKSFYNRRPPQLALGMVAGRSVVLPAPSGVADLPMAGSYGEPQPSKANSKGAGCSADPNASDSAPVPSAAWCSLLGLIWFVHRRRRA